MPESTSISLLNMVYALFFFLIGYLLADRLSKFIEKPIERRFSPHHAQLTGRGVYYITLIAFVIIGLQHLGFNLTVLLGAAGVFTVAISFASQTAASNLISGIFLLFERPFKVGDSICVQGISGVVKSIDLLSSKIKTPDNTLIRIPNETLIKSNITNLSYFTTRRLELLVTVTGDTLLTKAKACLLTVAEQASHVLKTPMPVALIQGFEAAGIVLKLQVWINTDDSSMVKSLLQENITIAFEEQKIQISYPAVALQKSIG